MASSISRSKYFNLRFSEPEYRIIVEAARKRGESPAEFVRNAAKELAEKVQLAYYGIDQFDATEKWSS